MLRAVAAVPGLGLPVRLMKVSIIGLPLLSALAGVAVVAALVAIRAAWRDRGWSATATVAILAAVVAGAGAVNWYYGYFPNLGALAGVRAANQVGHAAFHRRLAEWKLAAAAPAADGIRRLGPDKGIVVQEPTVPAPTGFVARPTQVYLPAAYFRMPRPALPVIMMIQGVPGTPEDWTRAGAVDLAADRFAQGAGGMAPIIVMPDPNGGFFRDTQCIDGRNGLAETYLTDVVPNWVVRHFGIAADRAAWAIGGASSGGYCALMLALRHPERFSTVLAFSSPSHATYTGGRPERLLEGTGRTLAQYNVGTLLAQGLRQPLSIRFSVGQDDPYLAENRTMAALARRAGADSELVIAPGARHSWTYWQRAFAASLPWAANRLGLPIPPPGPGANPVAASARLRTSGATGQPRPGR